MKYRTRQEIFDIAYRGLASQGFEQSSSSDGKCFYRGPNGRKCAIGWLISEEDYSPEFEATGVGHETDVVTAAPLMAAARIAQEDAEFVYDLQRCHDHKYSPDEMERGLRTFASYYSLTIPEVSP